MDNQQTPLGVVITSASQHESQHIERLIDAAVVELPQNVPLIYDKAADSDPLRERLASRGITLIAPYKRNRKTKRPLHYRHQRRLKQRWKIERTPGCIATVASPSAKTAAPTCFSAGLNWLAYSL